MAVGPTALTEPIPVPEGEPRVRAASPAQWVTQNLFNTWYNAVLTVVFAVLLAWVGFKAARFVFVTGRWEIIRVNLMTAMLGPFPRGELYRLWIAVFLIAATVGVSFGVAPRGHWATVRRAVPLLALVAVLLAFTQTPTPLLLTFGAVAVIVGGWLVGRRLPDTAVRRLPLVWLATMVGAYAALTAFGGVGWDEWGGLFLTLSLAVGGIVLSFPLGVLLALGRRSSLPAVRVICTAYIEFVRGVPLITILFIGATLGFLLPSDLKPSLVTRALIGLIAFTAAYLAEIIRGGLQGVPRGQIEAAQAIGLSPLRTTFLVVLPQALQKVIPAVVGQFISLFKGTALVKIIGLTELLSVAQSINGQPQFSGQGLQAETLTFACFVYWAFCYSMSRESQGLERRFGVGER
jgi:general L-amino acid transport system permease protein